MKVIQKMKKDPEYFLPAEEFCRKHSTAFLEYLSTNSSNPSFTHRIDRSPLMSFQRSLGLIKQAYRNSVICSRYMPEFVAEMAEMGVEPEWFELNAPENKKRLYSSDVQMVEIKCTAKTSLGIDEIFYGKTTWDIAEMFTSIKRKLIARRRLIPRINAILTARTEKRALNAVMRKAKKDTPKVAEQPVAPKRSPKRI